MKRGLLFIALFVCALSAESVWSQDSSAVNVQASCAHWARVRVDKHKQFKGDTDDVYQTGVCFGYFAGMIDGMNNTGGWQTSDGTIAAFQIKTSAIDSTWDVIRSFYAYVDANPLAKGKPAWSVLQGVLTSNGLASFVPEADPKSQLSSECKTGATNVLTEFNADSDLRNVDTATLASAVDKLVTCWNTPHISDADSKLVLHATTVAEWVLVNRAMNVLTRHALVPEFTAEHSNSVQTKAVSNVPSGTGTEQ
jgi:hypothetical protein